jgi:hypothetical protein
MKVKPKVDHKANGDCTECDGGNHCWSLTYYCAAEVKRRNCKKCWCSKCVHGTCPPAKGEIL